MNYIPEEDQGSLYFEAIDFLAEFLVERAKDGIPIEQLKQKLNENLDRYINYRKN